MWTIGNRSLTQEEMEGNAKEIYTYLSAKGWTNNAIAGLLGNMQTESGCNPGIWQGLEEDYTRGFGLVQWTPATNYTDWATANGYDITDPEGQLKWIDELSEAKGQWIRTSSYDLSWDDYKASEKSAEYLASAFLKNFERAGVEVEEKRKEQAKTWYDWLGESTGVYIVCFVPA